ncbi:hypothetical protein AAH678_27205 [Sodalis endosymbiont of Spalangia cameroni]|uniref:hypothetical protein n=1 Tax=Sodalis praecaptivus TaxID=1239307 RepID=UPI0031F863A0
MAEYTLDEAYKAVIFLNEHMPSSKTRLEAYIYSGFIAAATHAAETTSLFEKAMQKNHKEIMLSEAVISQEMNDKFIENYNNIMRFSAYANYLASIVSDALETLQSVFLRGEDLGKSLQDFIKLKLFSMLDTYGNASDKYRNNIEIEEIASIAKLATEREKLIGEKDKVGQEKPPLNNAAISTEAALITAGVVTGTGVVALGAAAVGKAAANKIAAAGASAMLSVSEGAVGAYSNSSQKSDNTQHDIAALENLPRDDISIVMDQPENSADVANSDTGLIENENMTFEDHSLTDSEQTAEAAATSASDEEAIRVMVDRLRSLRKDLAAAKANVSSRAQEADRAYNHLKEMTGRRMVYGEKIYSSENNKKAFINYRSLYEKYRQANIEYSELKELEQKILFIGRVCKEFCVNGSIA